MERLRLSEMEIGEIDAKNEILRQSENDARVFNDGFLVPSHFRDEAIDNGSIMYLVGFKGTGKTSLLRWMADRRVKSGRYVKFLLFKSDILEEDRQAISRGVWLEFIDVERQLTSLITQDFKYAWIWILLDKIFESIVENGNIATKNKELEHFAKVLGYEIGLGRQITTQKRINLLPKIASGKVEISAKSPVVSAGVTLEVVNKDTVKLPFSELVKAARAAAMALNYTGRKLFIFVDELEAFSTTPENFDRDVRMIRDLLFAVHDMNRYFRERKIPIYIIAAVRSEVLAVVNKIGEEVGRSVQDFSFLLDWSTGKKDRSHPLIHLIEKKIKASEIERFGNVINHEPVNVYFPEYIGGVKAIVNLLDSSMYRPRDLVRRLRLVRGRHPNAREFEEEWLRELFPEYSRQIWQEVSEELVPAYNVSEVNAIERSLAGFQRYFFKNDFDECMSNAARRDEILRDFLNKHTTELLLQDLFRLGVVGNEFTVKIGERTQKRNRWAYRGETTLATDKRMVFHRSLWPHLSLVDARPVRPLARTTHARQPAARMGPRHKA